MFVTSLVSKLERSRLVTALAYLNIFFISFTLLVLKLLKFTDVRFLVFANISDISSTLLVSKLERFKVCAKFPSNICRMNCTFEVLNLEKSTSAVGLPEELFEANI